MGKYNMEEVPGVVLVKEPQNMVFLQSALVSNGNIMRHANLEHSKSIC